MFSRDTRRRPHMASHIARISFLLLLLFFCFFFSSSFERHQGRIDRQYPFLTRELERLQKPLKKLLTAAFGVRPEAPRLLCTRAGPTRGPGSLEALGDRV